MLMRPGTIAAALQICKSELISYRSTHGKSRINVNERKPLATMPVQVRYHECDPSGIVFHPHYLTWADMASFECLEASTGPYADLADRGLGLVVADSSVRYLAPCTAGDELVVTGFLDHVGTTSMVLRFEIHKPEVLVAEVTNRYVWVDAESVKPMALPEDVRTKLVAHLPED